MKQILTKQKVGDMLLLYLYDTNNDRIGLSMVPESLEDKITLDGDWNIESLIHLKLVGDPYTGGFSSRESMRYSEPFKELTFCEQYVEYSMGAKTIVTVLESKKLLASHKVRYQDDAKTVTVSTEIKNRFINPITLEMVSSFSICGWPMIGTGIRSDDMKLYRMRRKQSAKGKLKKEIIIDAQVEPSRSQYGVQSIRFGQVGASQDKEYFKGGVVEEQKYGVCLGAMVNYDGAYQTDVYSYDNRRAVVGVLGRSNKTNWTKTLRNGESFGTPETSISVVAGEVEMICARLAKEIQPSKKESVFADETKLILINEIG